MVWYSLNIVWYSLSIVWYTLNIVWYFVILCDIHLIFVKAVSTKKGFMAVVPEEGLVVTCTTPTGSRTSAVFIVRHIINIHLLNECGLVVI